MAVVMQYIRASSSSILRKGCERSRCLLTRPGHWSMGNMQTLSTFDENKERLFSEVSIEIKGNDEAVLDSYSQFITKAAACLKIKTNQIALPRNIERYTILKSPHIYKKHRVQYEIRTHRLLIQFKELTGTTSDVFLEYIQRNCPEGVSMGVQHTELEELPINIPPEAQTFLETQNKYKFGRT
ncbi:28S ribosomal protein S10, mitochondrial-like [Dendronephthya gigantea]|uniref:28S ribosomal protein S10, mitochondrial-like n=1 Tax=Dendronephthya gigantea TaxID=151771 RepID=UPI00106D2B9D|nr:28S ribosomal protein S10, mitochondrial-like [Dendronephthya gigantea]